MFVNSLIPQVKGRSFSGDWGEAVPIKTDIMSRRRVIIVPLF
jgi:hypothetical protein